MKKNDWQDLNLIGRVKSLKDISFMAVESFDKVEKNFRSRGGFYMDKYGSKDLHYMFGSKGFILELCYLDSEDSIFEKRVYDRGDKGEIRKFIRYDSENNIITQTDCKVDELGLVRSESVYDAQGGFERRFDYKYDSDGNLIEQKQFDSEENLDVTIKYEIDSNHQVISWSKHDSEGTLTQEYFYKYDKNGNQIEERKTNQYGLDNLVIVMFDDSGNRIERCMYDSDRTLYSKWEYKYDHIGNQIEVVEHNIERNTMALYEYKYKYDELGNWIERVEYLAGIKPNIIVEREIEYF